MSMETMVKITDFSSETMEYRIRWNNNYKMLEEKKLSSPGENILSNEK